MCIKAYKASLIIFVQHLKNLHLIRFQFSLRYTQYVIFLWGRGGDVVLFCKLSSWMRLSKHRPGKRFDRSVER